MENTVKSEIPDIYFDRISVTVTVFGVNFTLALGDPHPPKEKESSEGWQPETKPVLIARTGLEHAKVFAMLLRKQLKIYEEKTGVEIKLPREVYEGLGLEEKEW